MLLGLAYIEYLSFLSSDLKTIKKIYGWLRFGLGLGWHKVIFLVRTNL